MLLLPRKLTFLQGYVKAIKLINLYWKICGVFKVRAFMQAHFKIVQRSFGIIGTR